MERFLNSLTKTVLKQINTVGMENTMIFKACKSFQMVLLKNIMMENIAIAQHLIFLALH